MEPNSVVLALASLKLRDTPSRTKIREVEIMFCSKCGNQNGEAERFCRKCGTDLKSSLAPVQRNLLSTKDPDELIGNGIGSVFVGDGFFMVAVILSATQSSVSSLLWLFVLIPAFVFFGKGFADVFQAWQIRRRQKQHELNEAAKAGELPPPRVSFVETIKRHASGDLAPIVSVTERTTRDL